MLILRRHSLWKAPYDDFALSHKVNGQTRLHMTFYNSSWIPLWFLQDNAYFIIIVKFMAYIQYPWWINIWTGKWSFFLQCRKISHFPAFLWQKWQKTCQKFLKMPFHKLAQCTTAWELLWKKGKVQRAELTCDVIK